MLGVLVAAAQLGADVHAQDEEDAGLPLPPSAVTDEAGRALARRVDAFYAGVTALRARVEQRFHHRVHERDVDATGTLTVRRPDRLRLLYDDGRGLALEGAAVRAFEPAGSGLVHEGTLPDDAVLDLLAVLAGAGSVEASFDVRGLPARDEGEVLEVRPRARTARWDRALLLVASDGSISSVLIVDPTGSWLRLRLLDVEYPRTLPSGALTLPVPDGAPVVAP